MSYLTWRHDTIRRQLESWTSNSTNDENGGFQVLHVCQAPVEALFVDDGGLLALTERGVERVPVTEAW